jgi:hypothetical protein
VNARTKVARTIETIKAPMMSAAMPSNEAPPAAEAMASPTTSVPLHLENPRVVGINPTKAATQKTPQASSAAAWRSRVATIQIGPSQGLASLSMVASQMAQKSSSGIHAQNAKRSRPGTGTRSSLHGTLRSINSDSTQKSVVLGHCLYPSLRWDLGAT